MCFKIFLKSVYWYELLFCVNFNNIYEFLFECTVQSVNMNLNIRNKKNNITSSGKILNYIKGMFIISIKSSSIM